MNRHAFFCLFAVAAIASTVWAYPTQLTPRSTLASTGHIPSLDARSMVAGMDRTGPSAPPERTVRGADDTGVA